MNYLSHLYLSLRTADSMTGNLMGDFKPSIELREQLSPQILLGIKNHRLVDRLTDRFLPVKQLRPLFSHGRRRFAGVVTDIAFDYFLIKHWRLEVDGDLDEFIDRCYEGLELRLSVMPPRMQFVVGKMLEHDWLHSYATLDGIAQTIDQVSKRIRFPNKMAGSVAEIERNYQQIETVFHALFAHLKQQIAEQAVEGEPPPWVKGAV